jgi:hypothetical protein
MVLERKECSVCFDVFSEFGGGFADVASEGGGEIAEGAETGLGGDFRKREPAFEQEPFDVIDSNAADLLGGRSSEVRLEESFEGASGGGDGVEEIGDGDGVCPVIVDIGEGGGEAVVDEVPRPGGLARLDAFGREKYRVGIGAGAGEDAGEEFSGSVSDHGSAGIDAGERGNGELGEEGIVVDPDDADFFGDIELCVAAEVHESRGAEVVVGEKAKGPGEIEEPFPGEAVKFGGGGLGVESGVEEVEIFSGLLEGVGESGATLGGEVDSGFEVAGEESVAICEEVLGGESSEGAVVDGDGWEGDREGDGGDINDGFSEASRWVVRIGAVDDGDNAINDVGIFHHVGFRGGGSAPVVGVFAAIARSADYDLPLEL